MSTADSPTGDPADPVLQANNLNKAFGAVIAAKEINVAVPRGAVWSLIGSNGAGKTTFVNLVTGYLRPDSGTILFNNKEITGLEPRQITRLGISRSFQIPQLCAELTALENMLVSLSSANQQASFFRPAHSAESVATATEMLERFRIVDYRNRTMAELPAGVRKLLDIAMAITGEPQVLLLDEPTSGVAAEEKYPLMDLVMEALDGSNVTVMFVEHDMDIVARYSQRVLAFYDGQIIANDTPDNVMQDESVRRYVTGGAVATSGGA